MRVLVACEFSGAVRDAFLRRGHDAISCDLEPTEVPGPHYQGDVRDLLRGRHGFDLLVGFPPCTYLCNSGAKHLYNGMHKSGGINADRWARMESGVAFFRYLWDADVPRIVLENPIMHGHAARLLGVPWTQIIQPWQFGHREMKATCLRLRGVQPLVETNVVGPPPKDKTERAKWARVHRASPGHDRWKERSRTLTGIADAMAEQLGAQPMEKAA